MNLNLNRSAAVLAFSLVGLCVHQHAHGQVVRVSTTGVIDQSTISGIPVSDTFSFSFDVDLSMSTDSSPHPNTGLYVGAVIAFDLSVGNYQISESGAGDAVFSHYPGDIDSLNVDLSWNEQFVHEFLRSIEFDIGHHGEILFDSDDLDEILEVGGIESWNVYKSLRIDGTTAAFFAVGTLDSIEVNEINAVCVPDLNADGVLDFFDISAFLSLYQAQDSQADLNDDQVWDFFDVSSFLAGYAQGCP
ncbi:MAG: hypothetical protein JJ974_06620 [Phycisphaerales bacterium]|nr:hypothetical protein [Phycisphaerales bacterium]